MSFEMLIDTQDPEWRAERKKIFIRKIASSDGIIRTPKKVYKLWERFFMGELPSPFHYRGKLNKLDLIAACRGCPHQSMSNWHWFVEQICERYPESGDRAEFLRFFLGAQEGPAVKNNGWTETHELAFFKNTCLTPDGGLLAPLGTPPYLRPDWLFRVCSFRVRELLSGEANPNLFVGEWYELFKRFSWQVADQKVFLPEAGCAGEKTYPLITDDSPAPDGREAYPDYWKREFTKFTMNTSLKSLWFPRETFKSKQSCLNKTYERFDLAKLDAFEPLQYWRRIFMDDLANGNFPPEVLTLSDWVKVDYEASWTMMEMTYGRSIYREPLEGISEHQRLVRETTEAYDRLEQQGLIDLSASYDNSPALSVLEAVRERAEQAGIIAPGPAWDGDLSVFWHWLRDRQEARLNGFQMEGDLSRITRTLKSDAKQATALAIAVTLPERAVGLQPLIKRHGSDPKGNRVYQDLWEFVADMLVAVAERDEVICKARPVKADGQITGYTVILKVDGKPHKFSYPSSSASKVVIDNICSTLEIFSEKEDLRHKFHLHMLDNNEFLVMYLPDELLELVE